MAHVVPVWGDADAMISLVEDIAHARGLGALLETGSHAGCFCTWGRCSGARCALQKVLSFQRMIQGRSEAHVIVRDFE